MKRTLMQIYVKGSAEAVAFYQTAFDAPLLAGYRNDDGTYAHAELDVYGQVLALAEVPGELLTGNNMQFCLHFTSGEKDKVTRAYGVLAEQAKRIIDPLGPGPYSPHMTQLVDRYGVYWAIFTDEDTGPAQ